MSKELQDFEMSDELLISVFKYVSLYDLSDCKFELGFDDGCKWCNAELNGRVIDCIQYDGNIFHMMNNDGSFSPLNQMKSAYDAMQQSQHPVQAETVSAEEVCKCDNPVVHNPDGYCNKCGNKMKDYASQSTPPQPQQQHNLEMIMSLFASHCVDKYIRSGSVVFKTEYDEFIKDYEVTQPQHGYSEEQIKELADKLYPSGYTQSGNEQRKEGFIKAFEYFLPVNGYSLQQVGEGITFAQTPNLVGNKSLKELSEHLFPKTKDMYGDDENKERRKQFVFGFEYCLGHLPNKEQYLASLQPEGIGDFDKLCNFFVWFRNNGELHIGQTVEGLVKIYLDQTN